MWNSLRAGAIAIVLLFPARSAFSLEQPIGLEDCRNIANDRDRLFCYDRLAADNIPLQENNAASHAGPPGDAASRMPTSTDKDESSSFLAGHWELGRENKRGIFNFRPHHENYFIATYNPAPNDAPYQPFRALTPEAKGLARGELSFQLGFKLKLAEDVMNKPLDLWLGYTQRSFWQAANQKASSPFRETDYQPELMAVVPVDFQLMGLRGRFLNLGLAHQSNGQASTLSRSWNRIYAQVGLERGNFTLLARAWKRINEPAAEDDNPNIVDYMGRGDLIGTYRRNGHELSVLTRYNFRTDKGAVQLGWAFPLVSNLKGYVQLFSGYGYTLIDYNAYQRVLGLGILINY